MQSIGFTPPPIEGLQARDGRSPSSMEPASKKANPRTELQEVQGRNLGSDFDVAASVHTAHVVPTDVLPLRETNAPGPTGYGSYSIPLLTGDESQSDLEEMVEAKVLQL